MAKNRDSHYGKTSPEPFQATLGGILEQCSENSQGSSSQKLPMCLSLKMDGRTQEYYWSPGGGSIAWRTHDAQYWGVPQRRKRISLVADFRAQSAPEILFEPKSVSGNTEPCKAEREDFAEGTGGGVEGTGFGETGVGYWQPGIQTLRAEGENRPSRPSNVVIQDV